MKYNPYAEVKKYQKYMQGSRNNMNGLLKAVTKPYKSSIKMKFPSKRKMNYPMAWMKYGLKPFGDKDRDGVPNLFDCKPLNKYKQDWLPKKGIEMLSFDRPKHTCKHATGVCKIACFNKSLYKIYKEMKTADVKSERQWQGEWTPKDFYDEWHKRTYYQVGEKKGTPKSVAIYESIDGKKVKVGEYELPTDRTRFMSRGEGFSDLEDVDRFKEIALEFQRRDSNVLLWIPTRAWRDETMKKKIEEEILPLGNVRVRASTDLETTKKDHELLKKGGWGTMEFSDNTKTHTELGQKYVECPKTYQHDTSACKTCEVGCYSEFPSDTHLLRHGLTKKAAETLDARIEEKRRLNPEEYEYTHRYDEDEEVRVIQED